MGGLSIARGIIGGIAGAAGDSQTQQQMATANQQEQVRQQNLQRAKIAPFILNIKNLKTKLEGLGSEDKLPEETDQAFAARLNQMHAVKDDIQHNVHSVREVLHPDWTPGPSEWLKTHLTDRMHITNASSREAARKNEAAWDDYNEHQIAQSQAGSAVPFNKTPQFRAEQMKQQGAQALETQRLEGAQKQEQQKEAAAQGMEAQKEANAQTLEKMKLAEADKAQALRQQEEDRRFQQQEDHFNRSQARLESQFQRGQANLGTWSVAEDENGKPTLFNSKTGEQKDAPAGMHKSGFYAKQVAPLEAADMNINQYMQNGVFTGPDDLTLQHEFFTATQPATGFRMTKVQQDILQNSQDWVNSIKGWAYHKLHGTWYSPEQRQQIAKAAQDAIAAKKKALSVGGPQTEQIQNMRGSGANNDPLGIF